MSSGVTELFCESTKREEEIHPERNPLVRWFEKLMRVTSDYRGDSFRVRENCVRMATPLFVVPVLFEKGDSWIVPKGSRHTHRILETFTAVEATSPPAEVHDRDAKRRES